MQHKINFVQRFARVHHDGVHGQMCEVPEPEQLTDETWELPLHSMQQVVLSGCMGEGGGYIVCN